METGRQGVKGPKNQIVGPQGMGGHRVDQKKG